MAVPEAYDLLLPLLEVIKDKDEYKVLEITDEVIDYIDLDDEDKEIRLPNNETLIASRISTANTYLRKANLIESNRFMYYNISEEGLNVLSENPDEITEEDLMKIPSFREYKQVFIHDDDIDEEELDPLKELRDSFERQISEIQREIDEDIKKDRSTKRQKKYFQPKNEESDESFGIKANKKDKKDKDKHSKKEKKIKYIINNEFSPADELLKYAELCEKGYITREEFNKKKEELLNIDYSF